MVVKVMLMMVIIILAAAMSPTRRRTITRCRSTMLLLKLRIIAHIIYASMGAVVVVDDVGGLLGDRSQLFCGISHPKNRRWWVMMAIISIPL